MSAHRAPGQRRWRLGRADWRRLAWGAGQGAAGCGVAWLFGHRGHPLWQWVAFGALGGVAAIVLDRTGLAERLGRRAGRVAGRALVWIIVRAIVNPWLRRALGEKADEARGR